MKVVIRVGIALVILGLLAAGGYWLYQTRFAPAQTGNQTFTQIVPVRQGNLSNSLSVVGELDANKSQDLAFTLMDGTTELQELTVATGNTVKQGQVLARIDPEPYQQALDQAKSELNAAQKTLDDLLTPPTSVELAQADLDTAQAEYDLAAAKQAVVGLQQPDLTDVTRQVQDAQDSIAEAELDAKLTPHNALAKTIRDLEYTIAWYERRINLLTNQKRKNLEENQELETRKQDLSEMQADLARAKAQQGLSDSSLQATKSKNQAALAEAQQALAQAKAGGSELDLAKTQLTVQEDEVALASAQDARKQLDAGADPTELATAKAAVSDKQLAVEDAQKALDATELKAPFDGTVLQTNVRKGADLTASTVVLTLADLSNMQVVALVDETTIRRIEQGQNANISFDAFPGQNFQGKVLDIPLQGELQNDVMVYEVPLSLSGTENLPLLVGMTAKVAIETAQADNALLVPTLALQRVQGGYQLAVVDPNNPSAEPVMTPVQVGLSDGTFTQIVDGLQAGDQVVVTYRQVTNQNNPFSRGSTIAVPAGGAFPAGGFGGGGGAPGGRGGGGGNTRP